MALEEMAVEYVLETREKASGMGGKKLWHMYKREFKEGTPLGRDRFLGTLDKHGLKLRQRKRKPGTTNSLFSRFSSSQTSKVIGPFSTLTTSKMSFRPLGKNSQSISLPFIAAKNK